MNMDVLSKVRNRGFVDPSGKVAPDRYFNCPIHEQQGTDHYLAGVVSKARSAIGTELFFFVSFRFGASKKYHTSKTLKRSKPLTFQNT